MKKSLSVSVFVLSLTLAFGIAMAGNGNNLPPGPHYLLNIIAHENCPAGDFTDSNRHTIVVKADFGSNQAGTLKTDMIRENTIKLTEGPDFQVLDGNACSKGGAEFMLPANPYTCPENDPYCLNTDPTFQEYKVFMRLVGKPGTSMKMFVCADEAVGYDIDGDGIIGEDEILCSTESVVKVRGTGKGSMQFTDETKTLLTICLDTYADGNFDGRCDIRFPIFYSGLEDYFWQVIADGKAHAQLVFIPLPD